MGEQKMKRGVRKGRPKGVSNSSGGGGGASTNVALAPAATNTKAGPGGMYLLTTTLTPFPPL